MKRELAILTLVMAAFFSLPAGARADDYFFTKALPEPDRAEMYSLGYHTVDHLRQCFLSGDSARALAAMIRAQSIGDFGKRCDIPRFGIRFYSHGKLIADETICFDCQWITLVASDLHPGAARAGFDARTSQAEQLQAFLNSALPLNK